MARKMKIRLARKIVAHRKRHPRGPGPYSVGLVVHAMKRLGWKMIGQWATQVTIAEKVAQDVRIRNMVASVHIDIVNGVPAFDLNVSIEKEKE